jgi:hypothetical protein
MDFVYPKPMTPELTFWTFSSTANRNAKLVDFLRTCLFDYFGIGGVDWRVWHLPAPDKRSFSNWCDVFASRWVEELKSRMSSSNVYSLLALFALFTLMIIHFKRQKGKPMLDSDYDGTIDGLVAARGSAKMAQNLLGARIFYTSWSLDLGWGGVALCALASLFWIFLSKLMRFTPLSQLLM